MAAAQGTGTVASPVVRPGSSISIAAGVAFDDDSEGYAHRLDYRHAVTDDLRLSAMVFYNDRGGGYRYRSLELEAMHQLASSRHGWSSAIQIRGRVPDGNDGPGRVRTAWLNRWRPNENAELRFIGLASQEFGDESLDGLALETRWEATWRAIPEMRIGGQIFNRYNSTAAFGSFDTQRHSVGGVMKGELFPKLTYRINALTGVSAAAADFEIRFRLRLAV